MNPTGECPRAESVMPLGDCGGTPGDGCGRSDVQGQVAMLEFGLRICEALPGGVVLAQSVTGAGTAWALPTREFPEIFRVAANLCAP
jgi:hypothetical protein